MSDQAVQQASQLQYPAPQTTPDPSEARRLLSITFNPGEHVWLVREQHEPTHGLWHLDVAQQGGFGTWLLRRFRYDEATSVLYFLGEEALSDAAFAAIRASRPRFPMP
ncbi:hypothetical protein F8S13_13435 [Chloroflexia bacterium SDU3-3]|nr:hypothetical protein F8S13_13435 [Chloroflexia bacterium SDU3-3]